jgi:HAD superfamily hydrolase (TIGR01509 family)
MADIKAFFFDQDGVIIDTERDGHRVAFNRAFEEFGFDVEWSVAKYHELLQVAGGKERMRHYLHTEGFGQEVKPEDEDQLIKDLHARKTDIFIDLIESGALPLRPGVHRFMEEVKDMGLTLAVTTTSNQRAADAVVNGPLGDIDIDFVLAGDVVENKKPDPEIYRMALERTGLDSSEAVVIEDSHNGAVAAKAIELNLVVTVNGYTAEEDVSMADVVLSCLGEPAGEHAAIVQGGTGLEFDGVLHAQAVVDYFGG